MSNSVSFSGISDQRNLPYLYQIEYESDGPYDILVSGDSYNVLGFTGSSSNINSYINLKILEILY